MGEVLAGALRQRAQLGVLVELVLRGPAARRDDRKVLADEPQMTGAHAQMVARDADGSPAIRAFIDSALDPTTPTSSDNERGRRPRYRRAPPSTAAIAATAGNGASRVFIKDLAPEDVELKRRLFAELAEACGPATVLATNTSSLPVTAIATETPGPERGAAECGGGHQQRR